MRKSLSQEALEARRAYQREWRRRNPEKMAEQRRRHWEKMALLARAAREAEQREEVVHGGSCPD